MTEKYNQTIVILAFCSAFTDFLINTPSDVFYPRDRIIHIIISIFCFMIIAYVVNSINFKNILLKYIAILILITRLLYISFEFSSYFRMFYGNYTVEILIFTVIVFIMVFNMDDSNISQIGGFYIIANLIMMAVFIVTVNKANVINIYSSNLDFDFSFAKLLILFDVFTISIVSARKTVKLQNQKNFMILSAIVFIILTLIQGFYIKGDLLYRLSPLQVVLQVLSGNTVKRYDYVLNLFLIFNYFGSVVLYSTAGKRLLKMEMRFEED